MFCNSNLRHGLEMNYFTWLRYKTTHRSPCILKQEWIPVGCVLPTAVAICWGGVCLSECWDTPTRPGPGDPLPRCGHGDPPGLGLETPWPDPQLPPLVWAWRSPQPDPQLPPRWAWRFPHVNRILDTHFWKYYLAPTLLWVVTRMHSSRMRTTHLLIISPHALCRGCLPRLGVCPEGVCLGGRGCVCPGGVCPGGWGCVCPGGVSAQGVCLPGCVFPGGRGCVCPGGVCPGDLPGGAPPCEQNDRQV